MTSATRPIHLPLLETGAATNADELGRVPTPSSETSKIAGPRAWDAYEVWRRLIKEARDRRRKAVGPKH
ncbi:MAG: hypothetical protein C0P74_000415 [Gammaproteobacteria bacterium]|nr:hypothetical protein [Gammaproteobacteria bacterium]